MILAPALSVLWIRILNLSFLSAHCKILFVSRRACLLASVSISRCTHPIETRYQIILPSEAETCFWPRRLKHDFGLGGWNTIFPKKVFNWQNLKRRPPVRRRSAKLLSAAEIQFWAIISISSSISLHSNLPNQRERERSTFAATNGLFGRTLDVESSTLDPHQVNHMNGQFPATLSNFSFFLFFSVNNKYFFLKLLESNLRPPVLEPFSLPTVLHPIACYAK